MTREEAIARIKDHIIVHKMHEPRAVYISEALEMAIQALSQEPCDDAVSREAVMRLIENKPYDWSNLTERHNMLMEIRKLPPVTQKSETVTEFADRCRECGARYGKLLEQKSGKWIPVSKRLPEDKQEVQITYKINAKHYVWSAIWDELHCRFYDKEYRGYISVDYVTAWMPLPEPYKAESEEV